MPFGARAQTPSCTLSASPSVLEAFNDGQATTLTLTSSGATSATIDQGVGTIAVNGSKFTQGISSTRLFTATVSNGSSTATCSVTVTVQQPLSQGGGGGGSGSGLQQLTGALQTVAGLVQLQNALGGSNAQNSACLPMVKMDGCGCGRTRGKNGCRIDPSNRQLCPCQNTTSGFITSGQCQATGKCYGLTSGGGTGSQGGGMQGLAGGLQGLSSILQGIQALTGGSSGGGSGVGGIGGSGVYPSGCTQYYYTTSPTSSDPCAIYQPNFLPSSSIIDPSLSTNLLGLLGNSSSSGSTNTNTNTNSTLNSLFNQLTGNITTTNTQNPANTLSASNTGQLRNSLSGDVRLGGAGATVFANLKQGLTEVSGFFGGNTFGGQGSQSALARICASRPWTSSNFLGRLAPDNFFDELCKRAGYQVGQVTQTNTGAQRNTGFTTTTTPIAQPVATSTAPYVPPEADIRAEPASVRLGARTYIFWSSKGVTSCAVSGPSFTQNTLAGAGATVPITGPTKFTITCTAPSGSTVTDSVTVDLAI